MPFVSTKRPCARCCDVYECTYCTNPQFATALNLIAHLKKSPAHKWQAKNTKFRCIKCNARFNSKLGYIHHLQQKRIHKYDLHQAACCGRFNDVARLIRNENANETGASHIVKSGELSYQLGKTPMHCAALSGYSRCLRLMLSWEDGDPNVRDEFGQTPVHIAARCGQASSLRLLLNKGGSFDLEDNNGESPLDLATEDYRVAMSQSSLHTTTARYVAEKVSVDKDGASCSGVEIETHSNVTVKRHNFAISKAKCTDSTATATQSCIVELQSGDEEQDIGGSSQLLEANSNVIRKNQAFSQISEVSADLLPCEVIARGEKAITAFKTALAEGTSSASRLKIIVVGEVYAGKTSLVRSLSGQAFIETREKTHGIQTTSVIESIVQNTELNNLWKVADCSESHLDTLIARVVSDTLKEISETPSGQLPKLPSSPVESNASQLMKPAAASAKGLSTPSPRQSTTSKLVVTEPSISVEGSPRKLPATLIAKNLLNKRSENMSVKVNFWDFAGHEMYEPMHHVFMNSRSLYLVVFNLSKMSTCPKKSLCKLHYWLNSIASHTASSTPIILVGTHKAKVTVDCIEKAKALCKRQFAPTFGPRLVRDFNDEILFAVENSQSAEDEGITNLRNVIKNDASMNFSFVNEEFPLKWLHCEEEIKKYGQDSGSKKCLNLEELKTMLEERCMVEFTEEDFNSMMTFFHDSGLILLPGKGQLHCQSFCDQSRNFSPGNSMF